MDETNKNVPEDDIVKKCLLKGVTVSRFACTLPNAHDTCRKLALESNTMHSKEQPDGHKHGLSIGTEIGDPGRP